MAIEEKLAAMGISLPDPPQAAGSYVPVIASGGTAYVSGQIPIRAGALAYSGKVSDANIEEAKESAKLCAINLLAQLKRAAGSLDQVEQFVRISGFVNSDPEFTAHPKVINAASDMIHEAFGEAGRHSRIAVGVASLPLGAMTEIDAIVRLKA